MLPTLSPLCPTLANSTCRRPPTNDQYMPSFITVSKNWALSWLDSQRVQEKISRQFFTSRANDTENELPLQTTSDQTRLLNSWLILNSIAVVKVNGSSWELSSRAPQNCHLWAPGPHNSKVHWELELPRWATIWWFSLWSWATAWWRRGPQEDTGAPSFWWAPGPPKLYFNHCVLVNQRKWKMKVQ